MSKEKTNISLILPHTNDLGWFSSTLFSCMQALRSCVHVCVRSVCVCAGGEGIISGRTVGGFQAWGWGGGWGSSSIFHGFSPFRSAASHTGLTGLFSFISKHLSQTRRAPGFGRLPQEVAAPRVRGATWVFFSSGQ